MDYFRKIRSQFRFIKLNFLEFFKLWENQPFGREKDVDNNHLYILILNWRDKSHVWSGGAEVYIHELARRWVENGNHVTLFCGNDGKCLRNEVIDGVQIIRRGGFFTVYFWAAMYYLLRFKNRYHIIIDCENGIPFFSPLYARIPKINLMFHVHQEVFFHSLPIGIAHFAAFLEKKLMPFCYASSPVVTISPSSKLAIEQHKLSLHPPQIFFPGIDINVYKPGVKAFHPTLLYLGRLKPYKRVDLLLEAFSTIVKQIPHARLVIAGDGEERKKLIALSRSLGIRDFVKFSGKVSEREKIKLMQEAWVFVQPSMMEGWGITTIEANACGTPVVAANSPGLRDSVSHGTSGYLVDKQNEKEFSKYILKILKDTFLRERLDNAAVSWSRNFTWEVSSDGFLEYMQNHIHRNLNYKTKIKHAYEIS